MELFLVIVLYVSSVISSEVTEEQIKESLRAVDTNMHIILEDFSFSGDELHDSQQVIDEFKYGFNFQHQAIEASMKVTPDERTADEPLDAELYSSPFYKMELGQGGFPLQRPLEILEKKDEPETGIQVLERPAKANKGQLVACLTVLTIIALMLGIFCVFCVYRSRFKGDISLKFVEEGLKPGKTWRNRRIVVFYRLFF